MRVDNIICKEIENRVNYLKSNKDRFVLDGDTHPSDIDHLESEILKKYLGTPNYYQGRPISVEDLLKELDQAGIDMSLSWQNPATTPYVTLNGVEDYKKNYESLYAANKFIFELSMKYPNRIIPAGWTDPKALGIEYAKRMIKHCVEDFGFLIVKMNPAQNSYIMDSDEVFEVVDYIISLGAVPAFHYGGDTRFTPASALRNLAKTFSDSPIIGVHMGGGGSHFVEGDHLYFESRELGLECPNIFYILSAKRDSHIESALITYQLAGEPFNRNIACGSDAPYGKPVWNYGGFRSMFNALMDDKNHPDIRIRQNPGLFTDKAVQDYMGRNLAELIIKGYERMLGDISTSRHTGKPNEMSR